MDHRNPTLSRPRGVPERVIGEAREQVGWQHGRALDPLRLVAYRVQPGRAQGKVEVVRLVSDVLEVMVERLFV